MRLGVSGFLQFKVVSGCFGFWRSWFQIVEGLRLFRVVWEVRLFRFA